jgi:hypothetical protein
MVEENSPTKHGMFCSSWDCNELRIYLKQQCNVAVSNEQIRKKMIREI